MRDRETAANHYSAHQDLQGWEVPPFMGVVMKAVLKSVQRPLIIWVAGTIFCVVYLVIGAMFAGPSAQAATDANVRRSAAAMPSCMRRVTVTSKPCGATIYIDGIQVGRTPMSFPMPTGRYTLVLLAPGHQRYVQRILVPDAPLEIQANLAVTN